MCQPPQSLWHGGTELTMRGAKAIAIMGNGRKVVCHAVAHNSPPLSYHAPDTAQGVGMASAVQPGVADPRLNEYQ